jgi:hypothetical protein
MSMMKLLKVLDRVTGYVYVPNATSTHTANTHALFSSAMGIREEDLGDVDDVQERWIDRKEEYDEIERESWKRESWKREGETRAETDEE